MTDTKTIELLAKEPKLAEFLMVAQCGLVLRGYDKQREIEDPILREVWRLGRKLNKQRALREKRR
jgi:hypothetical protein